MSSKTQNPRRSDTDIIQFIRDLPGGNVPQYAKLLGTTAIRINNILVNHAEGRKVARSGIVCAAEKGTVPAWANGRTVRGSLRARDVDRMFCENKLPPFITKELERTRKDYRDDALNFFRSALEQSASHMSFETQITDYMAQNQHMVDQVVGHEERIAQLNAELARVDTLLERSSKLTALLTNMGLGENAVQTKHPMLVGQPIGEDDTPSAASA